VWVHGWVIIDTGNAFICQAISQEIEVEALHVGGGRLMLVSTAHRNNACSLCPEKRVYGLLHMTLNKFKHIS